MQDIQMMASSGDPLFGGGGGGGRGDRMMKPPHNHQSVKCPRCDSLNTKFCYYNNYNLSQPRHFCKSCRRYWTKGGVLRNVPFGGGCRKTKRFKAKPSTDSHLQGKSKTNSQSSSENSSFTAAATTTTATAVPEKSPASPSTLISFENPRPSFDPLPVDRSLDGGIFPEIGSFTNLMTSSNDSSLLGFNLVDISPYKLNYENPNSNQQCDQKHVVDPTGEIELSRWENRTAEVGFPAVDWQADQEGIFDLTGSVDQSYWSQTQWNDEDNDNPLNYLP